MKDSEAQIRAEAVVPTSDLSGDIGFFTRRLGFRLDVIFPADDPAVAVLSGHGTRIRLQRGGTGAPGCIRIASEAPATLADGEAELRAPGGAKVEIVRLNPPLEIPAATHGYLVRRLRDEAPWVIGRAGMQYRDLIPDRLGGAIIASHIRIPDGGPVPDMVHYHTIGFQLIYCYRGWVDLVYEDQGPPFRLSEGDCVIQPPEIRHRVLFASDNIEVIEIGVPAEHMTTIDHDMTLPTPHLRPDREFGGQVFCRHECSAAQWVPWCLRGYEHRETGIAEATRGVAAVQIVRAAGAARSVFVHDAEILFCFVMEGGLTLETSGRAAETLLAGDAFVTPPGEPTTFSDVTTNLELLVVSLPGAPGIADAAVR